MFLIIVGFSRLFSFFLERFISRACFSSPISNSKMLSCSCSHPQLQTISMSQLQLGSLKPLHLGPTRRLQLQLRNILSRNWPDPVRDCNRFTAAVITTRIFKSVATRTNKAIPVTTREYAELQLAWHHNCNRFNTLVTTMIIKPVAT